MHDKALDKRCMLVDNFFSMQEVEKIRLATLIPCMENPIHYAHAIALESYLHPFYSLFSIYKPVRSLQNFDA